MLSPEAHLERVAGTLRRQIGPAVTDTFPRTQAFMAAVILEKLARQVAAAPAHAEADQRDVTGLRADLAALVGPDDPPALAAAVADLGEGPHDPALSQVVAALYAARAELGPDRFHQLLSRVRVCLRARLDRQLEFSA